MDWILEVYKHKINKGNTTALARRCNDFVLLEEKSKQFKLGNQYDRSDEN